ncbi:hypothetical protein [uncultured Tenacibaculum sp.]|uniref:PKD domain-containing protein n=1 Tax=uncultured Tenacibaculum sp. TaxID=174713 RepID=UPI002628AEC0|nr:hypothetical protein [uncultured Tenacibaculum sp.]
MKKVLITIVLAAAVLTSCKDEADGISGVSDFTFLGDVPSGNVTAPSPTSSATKSSDVLFSFDFETDNEGFTGRGNGNGWYKPNEPLENIVESIHKCDFSRGKKEDFSDFTKNGVTRSHKGNDSFFIGRVFNHDLDCATSYYHISKKLNFTKDYKAGDLSIEFDYYRPQDVSFSTGVPSISVVLYDSSHKGKFYFVPAIFDEDNWAKFSSKIPTDIPIGEYKLAIFQGGGYVGLDNIKIYTNSSSSGTKIKVNAGADATVALPTNTFDLNSTITNPDGETIKSIVWTKVSGDGVTIFNNDKEDTKVSNLQEGEYVFKVVVRNDKDIEVEDTVTIKVDGSKVLFGFTFEENVEGFTNVNNVVAKIDKYCRGRKANFPAYLGNIYSGNDTFFLGINQGDLNSWINPTSTKSINLTNTYKVNELGIQFSTQSIDPWGDTTKVIVTLKSKSGSEITSFVLQNSNSWVTTNSLINKEVPAGEYIINVEHLGGMTAIDDIYIYEK